MANAKRIALITGANKGLGFRDSIQTRGGAFVKAKFGRLDILVNSAGISVDL